MSAKIRKIGVWVEETHQEIGKTIAPPTRKAVAAAVIQNPFAGRYVEDLTDLIEIGAELGALLGARCVAALGIRPDQVESYGKAAMVGENGELEHAAAILHPKLGAPFREAVEKGAALIPSSKKRGGLGRIWISRWATRTRPLCARILTRWKSALTTRRALMKSSWRWPSPTADAPCHASAVCAPTRRSARTVCADAIRRRTKTQTI